MPATVTLRVTQGPLHGTEFAFAERETCILGRASDCSPRLPDDREHRTISRHHCLLDINPPDIRIRDFGSRNGTYVNGVKIGQRKAHQTPQAAAALVYPEHDLTDGDEIRLGSTTLRVALAADPDHRTPPDAPGHCAGCGRDDLSPHNLLLAGTERAPVVKICDFGMAKAFDQAGLSGLTRTGTAAGKPHFMPRQQVINFKHAQPEVDAWALAACLYWLLTASPPRDFHRGKDPWRVVLQDQPVPIRHRDSALPGALADVIDQALRDQPTIGFRSAAALRDALERVR